MTEKIEIKLLDDGDTRVLETVAPGVFDDPIDLGQTEAFLEDDRHHLAVAIEDGMVVGFVSAVHYLHPDKPCPELWINEVGVAPSHQRRGFGKDLMRLVLEAGRQSGCSEAWVLTEPTNTVALRLYAASGGLENPGNQVMFSFSLKK